MKRIAIILLLAVLAVAAILLYPQRKETIGYNGVVQKGDDIIVRSMIGRSERAKNVMNPFERRNVGNDVTNKAGAAPEDRICVRWRSMFDANGGKIPPEAAKDLIEKDPGCTAFIKEAYMASLLCDAIRTRKVSVCSTIAPILGKAIESDCKRIASLMVGVIGFVYADGLSPKEAYERISSEVSADSSLYAQIRAFASGDEQKCEQLIGASMGAHLLVGCKAIARKDPSLCDSLANPYDAARCKGITNSIIQLRSGNVPNEPSFDLAADAAYIAKHKDCSCSKYFEHELESRCSTFLEQEEK